MKVLRYVLLFLLAFCLIWVVIPENIAININQGLLKVHVILNPPVIDLSRFNINFKKEFKTELGLDLRGGSHLVFEADTRNVKKEDIEDAVLASRDVIERRVNLFGVSEPNIQTSKSGNIHRIIVDLPGVTNVSDAVQLIGRTAQLSFKEEEATSDAKLATAPAILRLTKDTGLTGKDVKKASVTFNQQNGQPQVSLEFSSAGSQLFGEITKRNVNKQVAIYIDQFPISAPVVQQPILDGNAVISGNFTMEAAKQLAININSGALPLTIRLVEQRNIGPTLGAIEVRKSVTAGVIGLMMVMLFMVLYYGRFGLIACLSLLIYGLITFAIFRAIPVVLTLPGIAGFILSIGMAVDSNILIFERIKEERREGKDFELAIRLGFGRAIDAIKDANITTIIVGFILFNPLNWDFLPQFGLVRGFALTLVIGVATSLFTGVVITRRLINLFYRIP